MHIGMMMIVMMMQVMVSQIMMMMITMTMTTPLDRKLAEDTRVKTVMMNIGDGCTLVTKL